MPAPFITPNLLLEDYSGEAVNQANLLRIDAIGVPMEILVESDGILPLENEDEDDVLYAG